PSEPQQVLAERCVLGSCGGSDRGVRSAEREQIAMQRKGFVVLVTLLMIEHTAREGLLGIRIRDVLAILGLHARKLAEEVPAPVAHLRRELRSVVGEEEERAGRGELLSLEEEWSARSEQEERGYRAPPRRTR